MIINGLGSSCEVPVVIVKF